MIVYDVNFKDTFELIEKYFDLIEQVGIIKQSMHVLCALCNPVPCCMLHIDHARNHQQKPFTSVDSHPHSNKKPLILMFVRSALHDLWHKG